MDHSQEPISCSISGTEASRQALEWTDLGSRAARAEPIDGGVAMTFPIDIADSVEDLAAREAECCGFLSITTTRTDQTIRLEISSDHLGARTLIETMIGTTKP